MNRDEMTIWLASFADPGAALQALAQHHAGEIELLMTIVAEQRGRR